MPPYLLAGVDRLRGKIRARTWLSHSGVRGVTLANCRLVEVKDEGRGSIPEDPA